MKLRCSRGGACRDQLVVKRGRATLLRRNVTVGAGSEVTLRLKLQAPTRRALRTRPVKLALALTKAKVTRSVTVRR